MFLHLSVILLTGGGHAWPGGVCAGGACVPGGHVCLGGICDKGTCMVKGGMHGEGGHAW